MSLSKTIRLRLLAMLLCIVMVFQAVPAAAFAAPDEDYDNSGPAAEENGPDEDEETVTEELAGIQEFEMPNDAVVTNLAYTNLDGAWTDLDWSDGKDKYFRITNAPKGDYAVMLTNNRPFNTNDVVANNISLLSDKATIITSPPKVWSTKQTYDIKAWKCFILSDTSDVYIKIKYFLPGDEYNAEKIKVISTEFFGQASENAENVDVSGTPHNYTVTEKNPFYKDLLLRLNVPEDGAYYIKTTINNEVADTKILDHEGEAFSTINAYPTTELEAGTYYIAYERCDLSEANETEINLIVGRIAGIQTIPKENTDQIVYYGGGTVNLENAGEIDEYYRFSTSDFSVIMDFYYIFESGKKQLTPYNEFWYYIKLSTDFSSWNIIGKEYTAYFKYKEFSCSANVILGNYYDKDTTYADAVPLTEDTPLEATAAGTFSFTAADAGLYYFYSTDSVDVDPDAKLYYNGKSKADDDGNDGKNFLISHYLKAGQKVILETTLASGTGSYKVAVTKLYSSTGNVSLEGCDLTGRTINLVFLINGYTAVGFSFYGVRDNLAKFIDDINATHAKVRISMISLQNRTEAGTYEPKIIKNEAKDGSVWYENTEAEALKQAINDNTNLDGASWNASVRAVDALANLVSDDIYAWNSDASRFAFIITGSDYLNDNTHGIADMDELTGLLADKGIAVSTITSKSKYDTYRDLADKTGGTLLNVKNDFSKAMEIYMLNALEAEEHTADPSLVPVTGIDLGGDLAVPLGRTKIFTPIITPEDASNKEVAWTVADPEVARVVLAATDKLVIKGIKLGTTKITAVTKDGGYTSSFDLTVKKTVVSGNEAESCDSKDLLLYVDEDMLKSFLLVVDEAVTTTVDTADQEAIYSAIKGKDKSIGFEFIDPNGNLAYSWRFEGAGISDASKTVADYSMEINPESGAAEPAAAAGLKAYLPITFKHSGELPGPAAISFVMGLNDGSYELYYYNETANKLEPTGKSVTVTGGVATFDITHCSTYVIGSKNEALSNALEVSFESNGGSAVASQKLLLGQKIAKPADPVKQGFAFGGWYKDAEYNVSWDFDKDVVKGITILYAKWDIPVESLSLDKSGVLELIAGDTLELNATVLPETASNKSLIWSSSDEKVATVTEGAVVAVASGKAELTVKSASNSKLSVTVQVIVSAKPTDTIIVKGSVALKPGAKVKSWEFEDGYKDIISVKKSSKSCTVKGKAKGTVAVKAVMKDGSQKNYVVRVENAELADRSFDKKDEKLNVKELITGARLAEPLKFKSSNKKIATVDPKTGEMTVLKNGKVVISATFEKTTIKKSYRVTMPEAGKKKVSVKTGSTAELEIKNYNAALGEYTISFDTEGIATAVIDPAKGKITVTGIAKGSTSAHILINGVEYSTFKIKVK